MLGIKHGDEVIVSSFTFSASVNPIIYLGAVPVLIDSEKDTWNMDPELLEETIKERLKKGKKPKAIIVVHLYGMPAKMGTIMEIANRYEIPVIEDAAEALGSRYRNIPVGTIGLMGIYSFNGNKIITTSGGGALVSENEKLIEKSRFLATQARDNAPHYEHSELGYNYRMSNVVAGIGRGQMEVLDQYVELRRENNQFYKNLLKPFPGITFHEEPDENYFSNYWLTCIIVDPSKTKGITRETMRLALEAESVESRPLWKPMHLQPIFKDCIYYGNGVANALFENGLCLPSGSSLKDEEKARVAKILLKLMKYKIQPSFT